MIASATSRIASRCSNASTFSIFATILAELPKRSNSSRRWLTSAAQRTKDSATKSASHLAATLASSSSFAVIAGAIVWACVTLTPLRALTVPGTLTTAVAMLPLTLMICNRGVPSPITTSERSVSSSQNPSYATVRTRGSCSVPPPGSVSSTCSPVWRVRASMSPARRIFGPWRSNITATGRPAVAAAARSSALRLIRSSEVPCEQLSLAQSNPEAISASRRPSVDGPSVATIFVRLSGAVSFAVLVQASSGSLIVIVDACLSDSIQVFHVHL